MIKNYIHLKEVNRIELNSTVTELVNSMKIEQSDIYRNKSEFIITFPKDISNESFIFFYCALMAFELTNSTNLNGWFSANDDMTLNFKNGDFSKFQSTQYSKLIMILPDGDDKGNTYQYGITEDGKEIHFGMDGTYKVMDETEYKYQNPISNLNDYEKIESIKKIERIEKIESIEKKKGFLEKLKNKLGI